MRIRTFTASVITVYALFMILPLISWSASFTPGSNATLAWTDPNSLLGMLPSNSKPFLVYGYIEGEENFSMGFEWGIFSNKPVIERSEDFICIKVNLNDAKSVNSLIATLHELSGEKLTFPTSTFVMLLKSNGEQVYVLEKTMSPENFLIYMNNTVKQNNKIKKIGE